MIEFKGYCIGVMILISLCSGLYSQEAGRLPVVIRDNRTRLTLQSAQVCIENFDKCHWADSNGTITFHNLQPGLYTLISWAQGYDTLITPNIEIRPGLNRVEYVDLVRSRQIHQLDDIVISERVITQRKTEHTASVTTMSNYELTNIAGTGNDINRVLSVHPSTVQALSDEFDNNLFVRGGQSRENVYLVDGIPFDNISHFSAAGNSGGAIGFLNSSLVQNLDFYSGGFPARMPSRISSVIDLNLRNGSFAERKHNIDLNMSGVGLTTEGPMFDSRASYLASMRLVDLRMLEPFLTTGGVPRFGDFQLKTVFIPAHNQTISLTAIGAFDHYIHDTETMLHIDTKPQYEYDEYLFQGGGGVAWDIGGDKARNVMRLSGTARAEESQVNFTSFSDPLEWESTTNITQWNENELDTDFIVDIGDTLMIRTSRYKGKQIEGTMDRRWRMNFTNDLSLYVGEQDQINAGLFTSYEHMYIKEEKGLYQESIEVYFPDGITPSVIPGSFNNNTIPYSADSSLGFINSGGYLEYIFQRGALKGVAGLRGDYFTVFQDYGISPRLGVSFNTNSWGTFLFSGGLYYQFPAEFSSLLLEMIDPSPNSDTATALLEDVRLQRNWQAILGYERQLGDSHLLTAETYYKYYDREFLLFQPGRRLYHTLEEETLNLKWDLANPEGRKRAYGFELSFRKERFDAFYYSLNYSLSRVENKYVNRKWYDDEYSLRNVLGISVGSNFSKNHGLSMRLQLSEGKKYSPMVFDPLIDFWYFEENQFNSRRLDPVISINLRYSFRTFFDWGNVTGYLEVWNLTNSKPVVRRKVDFFSPYLDFRANGIIPVAGLSVEF
ncbi:TonB-dependent receptor plug [Chitinispirillum alkaliphilum]|nr:TonB-dependent receptor plug [Chitinispirillum alkaliphilum]